MLAPPAQAATVSLKSSSGLIDEETNADILPASVSVSVDDLVGEVNDLTVRIESSVVVVTDRAVG